MLSLEVHAGECWLPTSLEEIQLGEMIRINGDRIVTIGDPLPVPNNNTEDWLFMYFTWKSNFLRLRNK